MTYKRFQLQAILFAIVALALAAFGVVDVSTFAYLSLFGPTLGLNGRVTLHDVAKSLDPDGKTSTVVELLNQTNEIITDMNWMEGNLPTGHETTVRTGLPTAIWRQLYQGVPASKSGRAKITDSVGMLETRAEVDVEAVNLNGHDKDFRLSESRSFFETLNQQFAQTLIYGNTAINPERFMGLAPRYSTLTGATNSVNVIGCGSGASGAAAGSDNTSVWLVVWGRETITGIYPKGSTAGLSHQDLGEYDAFDGNQNRFRALGDLWKWKCGLTVRDWRYAVRICNIDVSDLVALTGTQAVTASTFILRAMTRALARIPAMGMGTPVFYANRTVREFLSIAAMEKTSNVLKYQDGLNQLGTVTAGSVAGGTITFQGVPVRLCDQILTTETGVA